MSPKPIKQKQKINVNQPENQMENFFAWSIPIASKKKPTKKLMLTISVFGAIGRNQKQKI